MELKQFDNKKGQERARTLQAIFESKSKVENIYFSLCSCLYNEALIATTSELEEVDIKQFIRCFLDNDKLMRTYIHNRIISKTPEGSFVFVGNHLKGFEAILGLVFLPRF
ncbi:MAG: hypothetical protein ACPG4W_00265 [Flavobacteriales bacterium]